MASFSALRYAEIERMGNDDTAMITLLVAQNGVYVDTSTSAYRLEFCLNETLTLVPETTIEIPVGSQYRNQTRPSQLDIPVAQLRSKLTLDESYTLYFHELKSGTNRDPRAFFKFTFTSKPRATVSADDPTEPTALLLDFRTATQSFTVTPVIVGPQGVAGFRGWTQLSVHVADGNRLVRRVSDYIGGEGPKPTDFIGQYFTTTGYTSTIAQAQDFRGAQGLKGDQGIQGNPGTLTASTLTEIAVQLPTDKDVKQRADGSLVVIDPTISGGYPTVRPTIMEDFANGGVISATVQYARSGVLSYFDRNLLMRYAPPGVAFPGYDPVTGSSRGLGIFEARTNMAGRSQVFSLSPWNDPGGNYTTIADNGAIAPDGTMTASVWTYSATGKGGRYQFLTAVVGNVYSAVIMVRPANLTANMSFRVGTESGGHFSTFNLQTGSIANNGNATGSVRVLPNGWLRLGVALTATDTTTSFIAFTINWVSGSSCHVWGADFFPGTLIDSPHLPNLGTSAVTRGAVTATLDLTGANFRQGQGTIYVEVFQPIGSPAQGSAVDIWQDSNNKISFRSAQTLFNTSASGSTVSYNMAGFPQGVWNRLALRFAPGDVKLARNGAVTGTLNIPVLPSAFSKAYFGVTDQTAFWLNGHVREFRTYSIPLSDNELIALTAY